MILHREAQTKTFESIKQKYSKHQRTVSASPFTPHTPTSLKENYNFIDLKKTKELSKSPVKYISPLKLRNINTQDQSQKNIDRIRQKFRHQEYMSKPSYFTQRANTQRALNRQSKKPNNITNCVPSSHFQSSPDYQEMNAFPFVSTTKGDISKSSPIRKYLDGKQGEQSQIQTRRNDSSSRFGGEQRNKWLQQRQSSNQTITNIENIMKSIKATLYSNI